MREDMQHPKSAKLVIESNDGSVVVYDINDFPKFWITSNSGSGYTDTTFHLNTVRSYKVYKGPDTVPQNAPVDTPTVEAPVPHIGRMFAGYIYGQWSWPDEASDAQLRDDIEKARITPYVLAERQRARERAEAKRRARIEKLAGVLASVDSNDKVAEAEALLNLGVTLEEE